MDKQVKILNKRIKQLEKRLFYLSSIIQLIPGNIYWKDRQGYYLGCNGGIVELSNFSSPDDIIGKTLYDIFDPKHAKKIEEIDEHVMSVAASETIEEHGYGKDGKPAVYLTKKVPLKDSANHVIGLLGMTFDITDRKKMEIELLEAKERAEAANKAKDEFLANMRHDLRTPFSGIYSFIEYLFYNENDPIKKESLAFALQAGKNFLKLLDQILELTIAGAHPIKYELFNIANEAKQVTTLLQAQTKLKNLSLNLNCPDIEIKSDRLRIARIILNLVSNAVKFTNEGTVNINIDVTDKLIISVQDTGVGISKDDQAKIFEKFYKVESSYRTGAFKGAGLGLAIVTDFLNDLGGTIKVESELGKGATFVCEIPISC